MSASFPSLLSEQLGAARVLFAEAVRTRALIFHEALDARLLVVASSPTQGSLLAWAGDFFTALPTEGHIELEDSRLAPDFLTALRAKGHLELVVCAWSLQQELEGHLAGAVFGLGQALVQQQHLQPSEVTGIAAELGAEPTAEALRTVLHGWNPARCRVGRADPRLDARSPPPTRPAEHRAAAERSGGRRGPTAVTTLVRAERVAADGIGPVASPHAPRLTSGAAHPPDAELPHRGAPSVEPHGGAHLPHDVAPVPRAPGLPAPERLGGLWPAPARARLAWAVARPVVGAMFFVLAVGAIVALAVHRRPRFSAPPEQRVDGAPSTREAP